MAYQDRIAIDPAVRGGKPCIKGTRITVYDILEYLAGAMTEEQILSDFPSLAREDIKRHWNLPPTVSASSRRGEVTL